MKLAVLIRAHRFTQQEALLAQRLEAAFKTSIIFVTDDTKEVVSTGRFAKIGIRKFRVRELIGDPFHSNWGWQFGDVFYYAAAQALPDATHFALIESDVFASTAGAERLAQVLTQTPEDIVVPRLSKLDDKVHGYAKDLEQLGRLNSVTCFFPISRVSVRALNLMQELRRREREKGGLRINDEAIMASVAFEDDVSSRNLSDIAPDLFGHDAFTVDRTQLFEHLRDTHDALHLVHPVRNVNALLSRIEEFGHVRNMRRRFREALRQAAPRHRQKLRRALAEADARREQNQG